MTPPSSSLAEVLTRTAAASQKLGIDVAVDVAEIGAFLDGPLVVAVAGLPKTGRSRIGKALSDTSSSRRVIELDILALPRLPLWDILVVATPADRALSRAEEDVVRSTRKEHRAVTVAVTRADLLGDENARKVSQDEIERLRLAPSLTPIGVRWFFCGSGEPLDDLASFVEQALGADPAHLHEGPVKNALGLVLDAATSQLGDRLAVRERELNVLREIESQVPLLMAHAEEVVKLARLSVRDALREAEQKVFEAGFALATTALAWISRDGVGEWSDVELPLRAAWKSCLERAKKVADDERLRFHDEVLRVAAKIAAAYETLSFPPTDPLSLLSTWDTPALSEALRSAAAVDLEPLFTALKKECDEALKRSREAAENRRNVVHRIGSSLQHLATGPFDDHLRTRINADLEAILRTRLAALAEGGSEAATQGARADAGTATDAMKSGVAALRLLVEERHAWGGAYGELLEIRAWVGGGTPFHGV